MALHNTQCPHCFITYVISDEQLRVSEGMVRCGTCRERFQARILGSETEIPHFDPREAFIEPLSEEPSMPQKTVRHFETTEISFADPHTDSEKTEPLSEATVSGSINSELSLDIDENAPVTPLDSKQLSAAEMLANIRAKQKRESEQKKAEAIQKAREAHTREAQQLSFAEVEQNTNSQKPALRQSRGAVKSTTRSRSESQVTPDIRPGDLRQARTSSQPEQIDPKSQELQPKRSTSDDDQNSAGHKNSSITRARSRDSSRQKPSKESLIDQVDSLVDYNLLKAKSLDNAEQEVKNEEPFELDRKPKAKTRVWLLAPILLIFATLFAGVLVYQLWITQLIPVPISSVAEEKIAELSLPLSKKLAEHEVAIPVRRNLNKLKLTSALTEAHPSRASTTLLRISIINQADFQQALPWLEMTLTDAEGRLVSRRNLPPSDYIYQNQTSDSIGPRELKKVTIELLSFPKQATGYQIKILNK